MVGLIHHHLLSQQSSPEVMPVGWPTSFEGPGHRSAVLIGARTMGILVDSMKQARTDPNTQLSNRLGFDEGLENLLSKAEANDDPHVALVYFDLDDFKQVNDQLGHDVGDNVLEAFAAILKNIITVRDKEGEVIGRIGGDEFAAGLRTINRLNDQRDKELTDDEVIKGFNSRIREEIKKLAEKIGVPSLSVSIGVVKFREAGHEHESAKEFKKRADEKLYANKRARKAAS